MPGVDDALDGKSHQGLFEPRPASASRHRARSATDDHSQPDGRRTAFVRRLLQPAFALPEKTLAQEVGCPRLVLVFAARIFCSRRDASDEHILKWICEER